MKAEIHGKEEDKDPRQKHISSENPDLREEEKENSGPAERKTSCREKQ